MRLSVFTASTPDWTPEEAARTLADQGWDGIEWRIVDQPDADPSAEPGFWAGNRATWPMTGLEEHVDDIARITREAGLEISGLGGYQPASDRANAERMIRAAAATGAGRTRITMPQLGTGPYPELFEATRRDLEHLLPTAQDLGVTMLVELHHRTITASASSARRLLEGLDPTAVGVIHDLGNLLIEGWEDPAAGFQLLGEYLAHVHLKNARWVARAASESAASEGAASEGGASESRGADDRGGIRWENEWATLRDGQGDVLAYLRALVDHGYDGWITLEDFSTELPLAERTADDLAYVSGLLEDVGGTRG